MTKLKQGLLKVISTVLIAYPVVAMIWTTMPEDITSVFPQYTDYVALITGLPSGLLGALGLTLNSTTKSINTTNTSIYTGLYTAYEMLGGKVGDLETQQATLQETMDKLTTLQEEANKLKLAEIELKLSNPLIEEKAKEIARETLGE